MPTVAELSTKLLQDAASFFESIGEQNPDLAEQMKENADVYRQMGLLLAEDPTGTVGEDEMGRSEASIRWAPRPWWKSEPDLPQIGPRGLASDWNQLNTMSAALQERLASLLRKEGIALKDIDVHWLEPNFYTDVVLIHISEKQEEEFREAVLYATEGDGNTWNIIDFGYQSPALHSLNEKYLDLAGHELSYLRFFMHVVRGDDGAFRIVDPDLWAQIAGVVEGAINHTASIPMGVVVRTLGTSGEIVFESTLLYDGSAFRVVLKLAPDGMVEMLEDEPMFEAESFKEL